MPKKEKNPQLDALVAQVTESVVENLGTIMVDVVQKELTQVLNSSLSRALKEGEFFRKVNDDMREGLEKIYGEIRKAKKEAGKKVRGDKETNELISEASDQLDAILKSTENATVRIMDIVEKHQEMIIQSGDLLKEFRTGGAKKVNVEKLIELNDAHQEALMEIMTALSFQDLTGQRIKKIITALKRIEEIVFSVYMSTGLKVRHHDETPEKDAKQIEKETKKTVNKLRKDKVKGSELKGPGSGTDQAAVDDLLAQLGLE